MRMTVTILGCGGSAGVPAIGNYWGECDPAEPKNRRTRSSILVQSENTALVVDTGPDFKEQMNRMNVQNLDAALYTHEHADHVNGIDELRGIAIRNKKLTPVYAGAETFADLKKRFYYLFEGGKEKIYPPVLEPTEIKPEDFCRKMRIGDISFIPFAQNHGSCTSLGYRFGDFAYSVDMLDLDGRAVETLRGIKTWVVDSGGYRKESPAVHANLATIYALNEKIKAARVILSSLTLSMDYQTLAGELPEDYEPAWDGLVIPVN